MLLIIIWLSWPAIKRRILIGSLSGPNFVIRIAKVGHSRIKFGVIAQNKQVYFIYLLVWKIVSVDCCNKDVRIVSQCLPFVRLQRMHRGGSLIYQKIEKNHYNKHFIEIVCLVHIREYKPTKKELDQHFSNTDLAISISLLKLLFCRR